MTIRKFWKKIVLVSTAVFWAGCNDDNGSAPVVEPVESSASAEQNNESSSEDSAEGNSSAASEGPSAEDVSSSSAVNACEDAATYPYVQLGTGVRCMEELVMRDPIYQTKLFSCCDGSYKRLDYSYVRNYTLLTDSIVNAEKIDSLSKSYCKQNGGVTDYSTYNPQSYKVSSYGCELIAKNKAAEFFKDSLKISENDRLDSCLETLENFAVLYGAIYPSQNTVSLASVTCADGTVDTTTAYTDAKNSYDKKIASCEADAAAVIDDINTCIAGATASSSSTESTTSSPSEETEKLSSSSDPE